MVTEERSTMNVVITKPMSLEADAEEEYKAPNLLQCVSSLFKTVRPGSDLSRFQLPPLFNFPKSQLQCYGESVYCIGCDMLSRCNHSEGSVERFLSVVAWNISTTRPAIFGVAPYNPILGETHHVSRGNLNVLLEQVSHHPPVSALHATDKTENVELIWCQRPTPKFYGTAVEAEVLGKRQLKLLNHGETYVMNSPKLLIKIFPLPGVEWVGHVRIQCLESGLHAELSYKGSSLLGRRGNYRSVKGKIYESQSQNPIYEIDGHWDRTVTAKDINSGKVTLLYNAKDAVSDLKAPIVKDFQGICPTESSAVWGEVSQAILNKDWQNAREAKNSLEDRQREILKERNSRGESWVPKHFNISHSKESGWDCSPIDNWVPDAPIIVPL